MTETVQTQAMGQWANAPLVFVLAQVRFPAQPEGFTERLQLAISNKEPGSFLPAQPTPIVQVSIELEQGGVPKQHVVQTGMGYNIARNDGRMLVRIEPVALTLAVNEYTDSNQLMAQWLPMVACLTEAGMQGTVDRLGLRYVDFVIPAEGATPEDYVNAPWNQSGTPRFEGAAATPGMYVSLHDIEFARGRMRLQYMRGYGRPTLPADLMGLLGPGVSKEPKGPTTAVIDTDRWMEGNWEPSSSAIQADFKQMHTDLSTVFKTVTSPKARAEWGEKPSTGEKS